MPRAPRSVARAAAVTASPGMDAASSTGAALAVASVSEGLGFSQTVVLKLVDNQGIDSPWTLIILSDKYIAAICDLIHRSGDLMSGKTSDRGNQISVLVAKNLNLLHSCLRQWKWELDLKNQMTLKQQNLIKITGQKLWRA